MPNEKVTYDERGREQRRAWYILVVFPGREFKIRDRLTRLKDNNPNLTSKIFDVLVPSIQEEKTTAKGKVRIKETPIIPQYVYVEMILNDETYHAVKIEGVRHILGEPTPLKDNEVRNLYKSVGRERELLQDITFMPEEEVQIIDKTSSFHLQQAKVIESDAKKREVIVGIELFGRETKVTLSWDQIQKR